MDDSHQIKLTTEISQLDMTEHYIDTAFATVLEENSQNQPCFNKLY